MGRYFYMRICRLMLIYLQMRRCLKLIYYDHYQLLMSFVRELLTKIYKTNEVTIKSFSDFENAARMYLNELIPIGTKLPFV